MLLSETEDVLAFNPSTDGRSVDGDELNPDTDGNKGNKVGKEETRKSI